VLHLHFRQILTFVKNKACAMPKSIGARLLYFCPNKLESTGAVFPLPLWNRRLCLEQWIKQLFNGSDNCVFHIVSVLPKFEVSVIHPQPIAKNARTVSWKVCAQYVSFYVTSDSLI